jgi:hypothetical protein
MARYELLVDGEARGKAASDDEARAWLRAYRLEHEQDDPDATHVQVRRLSALSWLTGGSLVPTEDLLDGRVHSVPDELRTPDEMPGP